MKKALEILTTIYPLKGDDYFLQISGLKFTYNPNRMLFDRVTEIWIGSEEKGYELLDYSSGKNKKLYKACADIYNATFLKIVGSFTKDILKIVPKDKDGNPVSDLVTRRIDADKTKDGIQEVKEWVGLLEYVRSFPDTNGDGIPDVPEKYKGPLGRTVAVASLNPLPAAEARHLGHLGRFRYHCSAAGSRRRGGGIGEALCGEETGVSKGNSE